MRCSDIFETLPLYADGVLNEAERTVIDSHLPSCPVCREELAEYRDLRLKLANLGSSATPAYLRARLRSITTVDQVSRPFEYDGPRRSARDRVVHWLMPMGAGAFGSVLFAFLFLSLILVKPGDGILTNVARKQATAEDRLQADHDDSDFLRIEIPEHSPEVNPAGALVALTKSIVRGNIKDEEVVVVADVFGDGLANIAEVVEPPSDEAAMRELQRAFETEPDAAPFLPTRISAGRDAVRVVVKIQRVDVAP